MASPAAASSAPLRITSRKMSRRCAPNAIRTPNSCIRSATAYATTPYTPTMAMNQRKQSQDAHHPGDLRVAGERFIDCVAQRHRAKHGQQRIDRFELRASRLHKACRIAIYAHRELRLRQRRLGDRAVNHGFGRAVCPIIENVARDTNDHQPGARRLANRERLRGFAYRARFREGNSGMRVFGSPSAAGSPDASVRSVECTAFAHRNMQQLEKLRRHALQNASRRVLLVRRRLAFDLKVGPRHSIVAERYGRKTLPLMDARDCTQPLEHAAIEIALGMRHPHIAPAADSRIAPGRFAGRIPLRQSTCPARLLRKVQRPPATRAPPQFVRRRTRCAVGVVRGLQSNCGRLP